ncbi:Bug family tripartite tricarboxylate transporter substrate binding protein [Candidimonas nitroreducens]|uniref:LacI family transcriptional regulator n=1 Tax=Candidimonas nitroreducens TaxID=683354 RepID=A0A225MJJ0_9BURK|nr:tripartite tricarboxylate transporter substrate-binding protein [Candidimonas nitroreducens]OWT59079.1 LacI family transcriptional regulator [Candidimonas nitroreducens]
MKHAVSIACLVIAACGLTATAQAVQYPKQPIKIIVPFSPGGGADLPARLIAQKITEDWGQPVVVENRPGATGAIAENYVAKSAPDGYTILLGTPSSHTIGPQLIKNLPYDPLRDLRTIMLFGWVPNMLIVNPSLPVKTVDELIAYAKSRPGKLNYSSSGVGSSSQIHAEYFSRESGIKLTHIPYLGVSPAFTAVVSNQVQLTFSPAALVIPQLKSGRIRALTSPPSGAVLSGLGAFPSEPSPPNYQSAAWLAFFAPEKTPDAIVNKFQAEVARILQAREVKDKFASMYIVPVTTSVGDSEKIVKRTYEKDRKILQELGIHPS